MLDYAIDLFKRKGYGSTSIEDLRLETGISKGLMYYHFKNKEELFVSCLKYDTLQHLDSWEKNSPISSISNGKIDNDS
ncbi:helix-turn-helix domain-containing protein [Geomicrobium sp. JCM 19055]|uniref:TetR/AcrR family transcriptional regulator n=1 Tax=Geomicrobium sp. JCM 19055 TaxID=1460649 RepID=UPI0009DFFC81